MQMKTPRVEKRGIPSTIPTSLDITLFRRMKTFQARHPKPYRPRHRPRLKTAWIHSWTSARWSRFLFWFYTINNGIYPAIRICIFTSHGYDFESRLILISAMLTRYLVCTIDRIDREGPSICQIGGALGSRSERRSPITAVKIAQRLCAVFFLLYKDIR